MNVSTQLGTRGKVKRVCVKPAQRRCCPYDSPLPLPLVRLLFRREERPSMTINVFHTHFPPMCAKSSHVSRRSAHIHVYMNQVTPLDVTTPHSSAPFVGASPHLSPPFPVVATLTPIDHVAMVKPSSRTFPQQRPKRNASRESPGRVHGTTTSGSRWTHSVKLNQLPSRSASHRQTLLRPAYRRPHWRKWMTGFRNVAFSHIKDAQVFVDRVTAEVVQAAEASSACGVTFKQKSP